MTSAAPLRLSAAILVSLILAGCLNNPIRLSANAQKTIDRSIVEFPTGFELKPYIENLTAPTSVAFDNEGSILVAEGGIGGYSPRIFGYRPDGHFFQIYPAEQVIPFVKTGFQIYGPIGGMIVIQG